MTDDARLLQTIGNLVARDLEGRFPALEIRFMALNGGTHGRMHINSRQDSGTLTGRIFELGEMPDTATTQVKDLSRLLENRMERHIRTFLSRS